MGNYYLGLPGEAALADATLLFFGEALYRSKHRESIKAAVHQAKSPEDALDSENNLGEAFKELKDALEKHKLELSAGATDTAAVAATAARNGAADDEESATLAAQSPALQDFVKGPLYPHGRPFGH